MECMHSSTSEFLCLYAAKHGTACIHDYCCNTPLLPSLPSVPRSLPPPSSPPPPCLALAAAQWPTIGADAVSEAVAGVADKEAAYKAILTVQPNPGMQERATKGKDILSLPLQQPEVQPYAHTSLPQRSNLCPLSLAASHLSLTLPLTLYSVAQNVAWAIRDAMMQQPAPQA